MNPQINNRRDILLLLLYSPGKTDQPNEPIIGRTRLVKMLFLFREEALPYFRKGTEVSIDEKNFYLFFAWNFGPFSREVYDDLTFFTYHGFIEQKDTEEEALPESAAEWEKWLTMSRPDSSEENLFEYDEQVFSLTDRGVTFTRRLYEQLSAEQKRLLREFKARIVKAPLRALLQYVYKNYESMTIKSKIREEVLGERG